MQNVECKMAKDIELKTENYETAYNIVHFHIVLIEGCYRLTSLTSMPANIG
jgi:hypothetical protein